MKLSCLQPGQGGEEQGWRKPRGVHRDAVRLVCERTRSVHQVPRRTIRELVVQFSAYPLKFLLQLLVHEHQSFDSATQITVTSGDDLIHILLVLVKKTVGVCV